MTVIFFIYNSPRILARANRALQVACQQSHYIWGHERSLRVFENIALGKWNFQQMSNSFSKATIAWNCDPIAQKKYQIAWKRDQIAGKKAPIAQ
jgi:hypothetical protein